MSVQFSPIRAMYYPSPFLWFDDDDDNNWWM
jgi:hypothetical protein